MKSPYPVLLLARELHGGGSERQLAEIALGLDRSRFEPYVGTFHATGLRADQLRAAGVPVIHFPVRSFRSPAAVAGAWNLTRFIRSRGVKLVHAFDAPLAVFATPVTRYFTRAAMLTSQRGHRDLTPEYRRLLRWTDRRADGIVVNCEYLKRHLIDEEGVHESLVQVCHNGIDLERFHPAPPLRPDNLPSGAFVIGTVSMLRPEKDLATLIHAFALVRDQLAAMKLVIVGSGPDRERLQQCARKAGVAEDCVWQAATADIAGWLRNFDIFVLTSRSEAFPNSVMEAMACQCAVVASNVGGVPELVRAGAKGAATSDGPAGDGATGLLFQPGNPADLAAALRCLIDKPQLRQTLAAAGERFVRERLSRQASAARMAEIYTAAIEKHGC
jgi:glycosyltransferase involved in cell wall biosynthesis